MAMKTGVLKTALVEGKPVRYTLRRSARARRLNLRVTPAAGLEVVLPRRWTLADVDEALAKHARWIDRHVERFDVRNGPSSRELTTGSEVLVFGRPRELLLEPASPWPKRVRKYWPLRTWVLTFATRTL